MSIVVLGGYGEMGQVISTDLSQTFDGEIVIAGRDVEKSKEFSKRLKSKNIRCAYADISDSASMEKVLEGADVLVNATNYYSNLEVMKHALSSSVNYLDLGGLYHMTLKQLELNKQFEKKKTLALLGCGATPGITNIMANHGSKQLEEIDSIHIQFGDKDYTDYKMPFVVPYSMYTVIDEFTKKPAVFSNGKLKFVEPLSGSIDIDFPKPAGKVNCFYTLHSEIASMPKKFHEKGIQNCSFRGGFDKQFVVQVKFLIDTGFTSEKPVEVKGKTVRPIDVTVKMLNNFIPPSNIKVNDYEFLRVELSGKKNGKKKRLVMYCKSVTDKKWNIPAGSWDTGVSPSIIAQMIVKKQINAVGVLPSDDDCIDSNLFFRMLAKRNMQVFTQSH
jgi:lysine 6-dehydrogenase